MSDYLEILLYLGDLIHTHPMIASFIIIGLFFYVLIKLWNYTIIPNGIMRLTQKNRVIDYCMEVIFLFVMIMIINCLVMLKINKYYSIIDYVGAIKSLMDESVSSEETLQEIQVKGIPIVDSFLGLLYTIPLSIFLNKIREWIQLKEIENKYTCFNFYFQRLLFYLTMFYGAFLISIGGVCSDNIVIHLSVLSFAQSIVFLRLLTSFQLGYADYKILLGYSEDKLLKKNRQWAYLYSISDDMQYLECGNKLSARNNAIVKIYSLQEISGQNMKIQPTYAQEFRIHFSKLSMKLNFLYMCMKKKEIVINNPLDVTLKYALVEIRYYRKKPRNIIERFMSVTGYSKDYIEIENWEPHQYKSINLRERKKELSYITLALADCEAE